MRSEKHEEAMRSALARPPAAAAHSHCACGWHVLPGRQVLRRGGEASRMERLGPNPSCSHPSTSTPLDPRCTHPSARPHGTPTFCKAIAAHRPLAESRTVQCGPLPAPRSVSGSLLCAAPNSAACRRRAQVGAAHRCTESNEIHVHVQRRPGRHGRTVQHSATSAPTQCRTAVRHRCAALLRHCMGEG
jgi:hypothetical protein